MPFLLVALWAFAEATVFFIVADVPISAIALRYGARRALLAALTAAPAAALGGIVLLAWAHNDPGLCLRVLEQIPGIAQETIDRAAADYRTGGTLAMLEGAFRGVPYKLYAYAAGTEGSGVAGFALASIVARLPRFVAVAIGFSLLGKWLRQKISGPTLAALFIASWTLFYTGYFAVVGI
jgi:membrane protein YqaA with SNARE-associated domain